MLNRTRFVLARMLLALALLVPVATAATVVTATPAVADHFSDHGATYCYEYDVYEYSTEENYGSATYRTDWYGHYRECTSGSWYWWTRQYGWGWGYWVYTD